MNFNRFTPEDGLALLNVINNKWFVNLSSLNIPHDTQCLLQLGDRFSLPPPKGSKHSAFEFIKSIESNLSRSDPLFASEIRSLSVQFLNKFLSTPSPPSATERVLLRMVVSTKKFLIDHPDLIITRADKGNTTVALDKDDYLRKMNDLLSDSDTYIVVKRDPTNKIISSLRDLLNRWRKRDFIFSNTALRLHSDGVLPRAYGLPKIHKNNVPLRIIISSINSPLHSFATYLHKFLYDNLPKPSSHITNSYELVNRLKNFYIDDHIDIISLDVVNLFTNVSHDLIIGGLARR